MIPDWARKAFGGQSDAVLRQSVEREEARREIENTRWYRMLNERLDQELEWTKKELRVVGYLDVLKLQAYADSIEIVSNFVRVSKTGDMAAQLLSERVEKNRRKSVDEHMEMILGRGEDY